MCIRDRPYTVFVLLFQHPLLTDISVDLITLLLAIPQFTSGSDLDNVTHIKKRQKKKCLMRCEWSVMLPTRMLPVLNGYRCKVKYNIFVPQI